MSKDKLRSKINDYAGLWEKNMGSVDARIRIFVGSLLVLLAPLQATGYIPIPFFTSVGAVLAGLVLIVEGLLNRCVLYTILGIDRCPANIKSSEQN